MQQALIDEMKKAGYPSAAEATRHVQAVCAAIAAVADQGVTVRAPELGTFKMKERAERMGRNPQTGESIRIAARTVLTFKAKG